MKRSQKVTGQTTPSLYQRLRAVAFLHGWTFSKALHLVIEKGLPVLEAEVTAEDREAWSAVLQGVGSG